MDGATWVVCTGVLTRLDFNLGLEIIRATWVASSLKTTMACDGLIVGRIVDDTKIGNYHEVRLEFARLAKK